MIESDVRKLFEEIDPKGEIPQGKMEELIAAITQLETNPPKDGDIVGGYRFHSLEYFKGQLEEETDWRKRAALAAKIISLSLE